MKTSIIYASMTGHSKKIANAIASSLNIPVYNINEKQQIDNCDLLFIVSGIYGNQCKPELLEYVKDLKSDKVKSVALITSSMTNTPQKAIRDTLISNGIEVKSDEYLCLGGFLFKGITHPNKSEIAGAIAFTQKYIKG